MGELGVGYGKPLKNRLLVVFSGDIEAGTRYLMPLSHYDFSGRDIDVQRGRIRISTRRSRRERAPEATIGKKNLGSDSNRYLLVTNTSNR